MILKSSHLLENIVLSIEHILGTISSDKYCCVPYVADLSQITWMTIHFIVWLSSGLLQPPVFFCGAWIAFYISSTGQINVWVWKTHVFDSWFLICKHFRFCVKLLQVTISYGTSIHSCKFVLAIKIVLHLWLHVGGFYV